MTPTPLTGLPRRGVLQLPGEPAYEVQIRRFDTERAELSLGRNGVWTHVEMRLVKQDIDTPDEWHADAMVYGHRWEFTADAACRELRAREMPQPFHGPYAAVDENGRVAG